MLKFFRSILGGARSVASIVGALEKVRTDLHAHVAAKTDERDGHHLDAKVSAAKADEAHAEILKAAAVAANLGNLLRA